MKPYLCLIIPNEKRDAGLSATRRAVKAMLAHGARVYAPEAVASGLNPLDVSDMRLLTEDEVPDLLVPVGGDGTIISVIRRFRRKDLKVLGINTGDVGFLAEVEPDRIEEAFDRIWAGDYHTEDRILLKGYVRKADGTEDKHFTAMNDITIQRNLLVSLIEMDVYINGQSIDRFRGDGMVVCTPTGSTAYNLSAGGPIVSPQAKNLVITPFNVHSLNVRSIVTGEDDEIMIRIGMGKNKSNVPSIINIDGQSYEWLTSDDEIYVRRSKHTVPLIRFGEHSFYQVLKEKLF